MAKKKNKDVWYSGKIVRQELMRSMSKRTPGVRFFVQYNHEGVIAEAEARMWFTPNGITYLCEVARRFGKAIFPAQFREDVFRLDAKKPKDAISLIGEPVKITTEKYDSSTGGGSTWMVKKIFPLAGEAADDVLPYD